MSEKKQQQQQQNQKYLNSTVSPSDEICDEQKSIDQLLQKYQLALNFNFSINDNLALQQGSQINGIMMMAPLQSMSFNHYSSLIAQSYYEMQQSFLPMMNQDPSMGQLAQKRQFVERLDDNDLEIIKQFILSKDSKLDQETSNVLKKRNFQQQDKQDIEKDSNRNQLQKYQNKQNFSKYPQSSVNSKQSRLLDSKRSTESISSKKELGIDKKNRFQELEKIRRKKQQLEYYSRTETETEQDDDDDDNTEDNKFEKKLSKQLKNETPKIKQKLLHHSESLPYPTSNKSINSIIGGIKGEENNSINNNDSHSSLHHSKRPKRQGTQNGKYYGLDTLSQRHDHSHYQLISYQSYKSQSAQPYIIYISLEALIILNIHSHLSEYEVIGFLGGYCYESQFSSQKYLIINTVIPCDSLIENQVERQKNVDLCPNSAINARQIIQSRGQQVLGWYHSHPFFPVEPSLIDIKNHAVYQKNFDLANLPFVALIIGPYSNKNRNESLCRVFHLVKDKQPFSLNFKQLPNKKMRKALIQEIKDILIKYKTHQDKINLKEKWCAGQTREEKLIDAIELILERNTKQKDKNDVQLELSTNLSQRDYQNYSQKGIFTLSTTHSEASYSKRSEIDFQNHKINSNGGGILHSGQYILNQESLELHNSTNTNCNNMNHDYVNGGGAINSGPLLLQNFKKESYFSIENEDRVEKFMNKLKSMMKKILDGEGDSQQEQKFEEDKNESLIQKQNKIEYTQ